MDRHHTAVWIDHQEAHVFEVDAETFSETTVKKPGHHRRHPRSEGPEHNHPDDEPRFFAALAAALSGSGPVLLMGPADEKLHFRDYVAAHASTLKLTIAGVETVDHPSDAQLVAYARKYLKAAERMVP